jgi:hypothetical protein
MATGYLGKACTIGLAERMVLMVAGATVLRAIRERDMHIEVLGVASMLHLFIRIRFSAHALDLNLQCQAIVFSRLFLPLSL